VFLNIFSKYYPRYIVFKRGRILQIGMGAEGYKIRIRGSFAMIGIKVELLLCPYCHARYDSLDFLG
jgi:hypothetical protein